MIDKTVNGYSFIGNINNRVILDHNPKAVETWVVWWLDGDGDPYSVSYFINRDADVRELCARAFYKAVISIENVEEL